MTDHGTGPSDNTATENVSCCGAPVAPPAAEGRDGARQPSEILIITDSCCNPAAAPAEERAVKTVDEAISSAGSTARSRVVSATDALGGALSPEILAEIQSQLSRGTAQPPMVMIDGQIIASGNFSQQDVQAALTDPSRADA